MFLKGNKEVLPVQKLEKSTPTGALSSMWNTNVE